MARSRIGIIPTVFILFANLPGLCAGQERLPQAVLNSGPAQQPFVASLRCCEESKDLASPRVCQLNPPATPLEKCLVEKREWVVIKGGTSAIKTASLTSSKCSQSESCESCKTCESCSSCESCDNATCNIAADRPKADYPVASCDSMDRYCADVTTHLATTLIGSKESPAAQKRAIRTALQMVVEQAQMEAKLKIRSVELADEKKEPAPILVTEPDDRAELLEPLIAAQYRNSQQLEAMAAANQKIQRSVERLENQMTQFALTQRVKFSDAEVRKMMTSAEDNERRELEIERLQLELLEIDQKLKHLQAAPVQRASYLEPVYRQNQPLKPIEFGR